MGTQGYDVVIGFCASDIDFVQKLAAKLKEASLTVWFNNPDGNSALTSDHILGCKIFLPIMTEEAAVNKNIQEQLSLAYISNSAIYPLAKIRFRHLSPKLNAGVKLMLAKINWCFVFNPEEFDAKVDALIVSMKKDLQNISNSGPEESNQGGFIQTHGMSIPITQGHAEAVGGDDSEFDGVKMGVDLTSISKDTPFWDRHFKEMLEVPWVEFRTKFIQDYGEKIDEEFNELGGERRHFIINLMFKDIFDMKKTVNKKVFDKFCGAIKSPHAFFNKVLEYVVAYMSLREVISMDSSLRITTIQSLRQYSFPAIVSGLTDMLRDEDPNIRAVAAIALAHAGKGKPSTVDSLISIIEDEDRLVRESACLSLGFLKSAKSVPFIQDRWRNDPISTVREAAELALSKMDTPDAKRCIKVTEVLSSEMRALKPKVAS